MRSTVHGGHELFVCGLLAVAIAAGGIAFLRRHADRLGLVDLPDARKQHGEPVPLIGGVALAFAFALTCLVCRIDRSLLAAFAVASLPLLLIGILDDKHSLSAREKLAAQVGVAAIAVFAGDVVVTDLGDLFGFGVIELGWAAFPFTIVCMVGTINAFNMTDGVDGLAGSLGLVATVVFGTTAAMTGVATELAMAVALGGALVGFLAFNLPHRWRPARVFLGDSGSTFLGFTLAWLAIAVAGHGSTGLQPIAAVWVLGLPLLDMGATMLRRLARRHSPLRPDRSHLHHLLLARGWTPRAVVGVEVGASLGLAAIGVLGCRYQVPEAVLTWGFLALAVLFLVVTARAWAALDGSAREGEGLETLVRVPRRANASR